MQRSDGHSAAVKVSAHAIRRPESRRSAPSAIGCYEKLSITAIMKSSQL